MKLRNVSVFAVAALVALAACKKDNDDAAAVPVDSTTTVAPAPEATPAPVTPAPGDTTGMAPTTAAPMDTGAAMTDSMAKDTAKKM